jgi:hypothetical protein
MTVKTRGPSSRQIGKPAVHPATIDLKGRAYEYVLLFCMCVYFPLDCCFFKFSVALSSLYSFLSLASTNKGVLFGLNVHCSC